MGHYILGAIVYAKTKKEALEEANNVFDSLTRDQSPFDYYTILDPIEPKNAVDFITDGDVGTIDKYPDICLASSKLGKIVIETLMNATKNNFMWPIAKIRSCINNATDEELFEEKASKSLSKDETSDIIMFRSYCNWAGDYRGTDIHLYDPDGKGIRTPRHLTDALTMYGNSKTEYKGLKVYVVCADAHS